MKFVSHGGLRPTASKVREALFSILRERLPEASFLDLYAGVGAVGIEALSEGAAEVVLVEKDPRALRVLRENLQHSEGAERGVVVPRPVAAALKQLSGRKFDVIFLDPPYGSGEVPRALQDIDLVGLVALQGIVVAEHHHKDLVPERCGRLKQIHVARYGETALSFYQEEPL